MRKCGSGFVAMTIMWLIASIGGCSSPLAAGDLIAEARKALSDARQAQLDQHEQIVSGLRVQSNRLDDAFDTDVKLAEQGLLKDADGKSIPLTSDWIISARKGYAAAQHVLSDELRKADSQNAVRTDNLAAADEALDMAGRLIIQQADLSEQIKQRLSDFQRRFINEK